MLQHLNGAARIYVILVSVFLGAALGSFLNCAAWRTVRGESFVKGRSRCPDCGHTLEAGDLVPILSWIILGGKCRYCKKPIPARYMLVELGFALITLACVDRFAVTLLCLRNLVFLCCLYFLTLTDLDAQIIPDGCLLIGLIVWVVTAPFLYESWIDPLLSLVAALVYGGGLLLLSMVMDRVLGRDSLGGGDIKLFALTGLYLGLIGTLFALLLSAVLGLVFALLLKKRRSQAFPFGPAIAAADALMLLFGDGLVSWYLGLLG
ncbi:MAG: prepilin peptidase [Ruminococcaceae bacterium]|jgi:leader peptidase (prepilin peptidase)/N-methyltransferase|nr:prepilin peptidase [Oscillospiraceae bacterium]